MNRLLLAVLAAGLGVAGYSLCHRLAERSGMATVMVLREWRSATNNLVAAQDSVSSLREQIQEKRERLRLASRHPNITPEMLEILEGHYSRGNERAWAQLREQLGLGWDASPDYVLVTKGAIGDLWFNKLYHQGTLSDDSTELLNLSPGEQAAVKAALAAAVEGQWLHLTSTPPSGDVVAQYTIVPPDAAFTAARSNAFAADITAAIGAERADLFLHDAWREFMSDLGTTEPETLTIRQTTVDGQPDLVYEDTRGTQVSTKPVRYANYPVFPVLKLFPGGWQGLAQAAGFELPPSFWPPGIRH